MINTKEIQEIIKLAGVKNLISAINRLAEAQEKANEISASKNKLQEKQVKIMHKNLINESRKTNDQ